MDVFSLARQNFLSRISASQANRFCQHTTAGEVLTEIQLLETQHHDSSRTRKLLERIDPFIRGIEQYGQALDVLINVKPDVLSLVWGSARIIIHLLRSFNELFEKVARILGTLGKQMGLFEIYSKLYPQSARLRLSVVEAYQAFLEFSLALINMLDRSKSRRLQWLQSNSLSVMLKSVFKPIKQEFESLGSRIDQMLEDVKTEADTAEKEAAASHRDYVQKTIDFEQHQGFFNWLDPVDNHSVRQELSRMHEEGTGEWIIRDDHFISWLSAKSSAIWLNGKPGAGKSAAFMLAVGQYCLNLGA